VTVLLNSAYALRLEGNLRTLDVNGKSGTPLQYPYFIPADNYNPGDAKDGFYPYAVVGYLNFDGKGNVTGHFDWAIGGRLPGPGDVVGNYEFSSVDPTFTGSIVLTFNPGGKNKETRNYYFAAIDGLKELLVLDVTQPGDDVRPGVISGVLKRI
jgi:hypothetical protein